MHIMPRMILAGGILTALVALNVQPAQATICAFSDVSLTIASTTYTPSKCGDSVNNGDPTQETANMNTSLGTTGFVYLDKSDDASGAGIGGITFVVTAPGTSSGSWTVTWTDTNGAVPLNLPIKLDLEVGLFGGSTGADYLLTGVTLPAVPNTGTGSFDITFTNRGGQNPDLSHLTLTGGNATGTTTPAPEPLSISLLGAGLVGLGAVRRRRA
jgi:hypothetical protein